MAEYSHKTQDSYWQNFWEREGIYKTQDQSGKPPYYILDMFPYPSGAGLHVGHPLGYIASDIIARFKRHNGYEVLHPMGYDAFGLPAEQFAIDTGNHPAEFTDKNIARYEEQLRMIGLSFDWSRAVKTSEPSYYKWTQWIFMQLFNSWYNLKSDKAEGISTLIGEFETKGNINIQASTNYEVAFSAEQWNSMDEREQQKVLLQYRMAYIGESEVNWCPELGTVLANEEVKDGFSERGGYPVERRKMKQWFLRIGAYAERLLNDLNTIDWPDAVKDMQRNWIGKSTGASLMFEVEGSSNSIEVFTTRPDTVFGSTFMVLAPEHELVNEITSIQQKAEVEQYKELAKRKSERERMAETKKISGVFTGAYAKNPFTEKNIPVWIADYVLADYGTGAIMAVPAHDSRDYAFAKNFNLPIVEVVAGGDISNESYDAKYGVLQNSDFLNGLEVAFAIQKAIEEIEKRGIGLGKTNYRLRDANFSRQRYWGEPFPVIFRDDLPSLIDERELPVVLPEVESYKPLGSGESPLATVKDWVYLEDGSRRETNTMPGWAGSSWYFLRYMDPHNEAEFVSKERNELWKQVDFYVGGSEHATGHLLYARFWQKFLFDRGFVCVNEPFKKLVNQGMIQGRSSFIYKEKGRNNFISVGLIGGREVSPVRVDISFVQDDVLDISVFKNWREEYNNSTFELEKNKFYCFYEIEKMSKSKFNVITPDAMILKYGCDAFRMYEMFLGPVEQSKPWNTDGIDGVYRFLRKYWNLFHDDKDIVSISEDEPTKEELKSLHKCIKKTSDDIERFSLNTCVSSFMICVNELQTMKCNKRKILSVLPVLMSPFAPHIAEETWSLLGNKGSVTRELWPQVNETYIRETSFEYPVSINGKMRFKVDLSLELTKEQVEQVVVSHDSLVKYTNGLAPKKVIVVHGKIVNVVL